MNRPALLFFLLATLSLTATLSGQEPARLRLLEPADSLHPVRFWACAATGTAIYTTASIGLYQTWYKEYELIGFHTFNDWGEWNGMDKAGHSFTAYTESSLSFRGALWTGLDRRKSMWAAAGIGMLLQSTVEVMDGFSAKWGFSWSDMGFNALGVGLFVGQELAWQDQRFLMKISNSRPDYSGQLIYPEGDGPPVSLKDRAHELFGSSFAEAFLKDYNGQTAWLSANLRAFGQEKSMPWVPRWLNVAVGYGAGNLYGGYANQWVSEAGYQYRLDAEQFPRYRQFFLSLDVDLSRVQTRSRLLRTLLLIVNWVKIPAPTFEINTLGQAKFHPIYW